MERTVFPEYFFISISVICIEFSGLNLFILLLPTYNSWVHKHKCESFSFYSIHENSQRKDLDKITEPAQSCSTAILG